MPIVRILVALIAVPVRVDLWEKEKAAAVREK